MLTTLRLVVSGALLAIVAYQVDWDSWSTALTGARLPWVALSLFAFNVSMVAASWRWQSVVLAAGRGPGLIGFKASVSATYASLWLSNFLPTAFGGDVARLFAARRAGIRWPVATATVIADRYLGLLTLVIAFFVCEVFFSSVGRPSELLLTATPVAAVFAASLVVFWLGIRVRLGRRWFRVGWIRFLSRCMQVIQGLWRINWHTSLVMLGAVAATASGVAAYWAAASGVTEGISLRTALAIAALGTLASAIPISLSGWGIREGAVMAVLIMVTGLSPGEAGAVALINAMSIAITSVAGLMVCLRLDFRREWLTAFRRRQGLER